MNDFYDIVTMSGIDKPEKKVGRSEKYPFSKLEIGQGFKLPDDKKISSMRVLASNRGKSLGRKFSVSVNGYVERIAWLLKLIWFLIAVLTW